MADGITRIAVEGFKSIAKRQEIEIRPLTILAGANSSGKSSIMQPLLMLKQTLEATYDPGALKIDGPNVSFSSIEQFITKSDGTVGALAIEIEWSDGTAFSTRFVRDESGLRVVEQRTIFQGQKVVVRPDMSPQEIANEFGPVAQPGLHVIANRFFLGVVSDAMPFASVTKWALPALRAEIHVPSIRGNTSRVYPSASIDPMFTGLFQYYVAALIDHWQQEQSAITEALIKDLRTLGLARNARANRISDVAIELLVNRSEGSPNDLVNIADVGIGVSQVLPVLVGLRAGQEGQLVYLEEPEIHLHPRAQTKLADILADAARRGVRVVAETHSSLLLRAIQTLVARGALEPDLVRLHWFSRDESGVTHVISVTPDENGAFGDWPEDFGDVALQSEKDYLDAVETKLAH